MNDANPIFKSKFVVDNEWAPLQIGSSTLWKHIPILFFTTNSMIARPN